jgi:hypothetical protein
LCAKHCGVFTFNKCNANKKSIVFTAHESKARACVAMFDFLCADAKRNMPKGYSYQEKHGYYYGYTLALKERIILSDDSQAALVLQQDVDLYEQHLGIQFRSRSLRSVAVDSNAIDKGKSAGSNVSLNQQFGVRALSGR